MAKLSTDERFWAKVRVGHPLECWEWQAYRTSDGYGRITIDGAVVGAHRHVMGLKVGDAMHALHRCDNPPCVNPAHLFLGSQADNVTDAARKGRMPRGIGHRRAKLTEDDVRAIRLRTDAGETRASIADDYPVTPDVIAKIARRELWTHVD